MWVYDESADTPPNKHENVALLYPKNSDTAPICVISLPLALSPSVEWTKEEYRLHVAAKAAISSPLGPQPGPQLLVALRYWLPSTTVCPRLLVALDYCLPSTIVCPEILFALNCSLPRLLSDLN